MDLREALGAVRAAWWLPLIGLILGGGAALGMSLLQTPVYTSTTQLFVSTTDSTSPSDVFQGSQFSQQRATSYAQLLTGEDLVGRVVDDLGLNMSAEDLRKEITATPVTNTVLIDVDVTDPSPQRAQEIAAALVSRFTALVRNLETPDTGGVSPVKVTVTEIPKIPVTPSSPKTTRNTSLGLGVGLLIGCGLAVARARLDRTVKDPDETAQLGRAPIIATILRDEALKKHHTIDRGVGSRTGEDFRQLRTNLQFLNVDEPPKVIMVASAVPEEGKTTVILNLALVLADAGRRVVVVEADLRRPKVTRYLGMISGPGLTNVLAGTADIEQVVQSYAERLAVIAAGPIPPNPGELLGSSQMMTVIDKLRSQYDYVLVDAPPVLPVADATALAVSMDGVLVSVRYGSTRKDQVRETAAALDRVGAKLLGVILNMVPAKADAAGAYGYEYSYDTHG